MGYCWQHSSWRELPLLGQNTASMPPGDGDDADYDVQEVNAPALLGLQLRLFLGLAESWLFPPVGYALLRVNGFLQLLEETFAPERPTFLPHTSGWDPEPADDACLATLPAGVGPAAAAAAAAAALSGQPPAAGPQAAPPRRRTAADFHAAYLSGAATPEAVAEAVVAAVAASEAAAPPLRAFIAHDPARLRAAAAASGERYRAGAPLSPLDGVPFAVKDAMDVAGYATTAGTAVFAEARLPTGTAPAVEALLACGALLIGKTNLHEIGLGTTGLNTVHGTPRNPHSPAHHTGGSSSGSAAAVAAGLCPFAIGTDGGGSIRIPSALCGLFGLKPTHGRVCSRHCPSIDQSVSVTGPIAGTAADCALAYAAMANQGHADGGLEAPPPPLAVPRALGASARPLEGLVAGVHWEWFNHADAGVVAACRRGLATLESLGVRVAEVQLPGLRHLALAHSATIASEMRNNMAWVLAGSARRRALNAETRASLAFAGSFKASHYIQAQKIRTRASATFKAAFQHCTLIATPTCPCVAPLIRPGALEGGESDAATTTLLMRFMAAANFVGLPAVTVPVGLAAGGRDAARGGAAPGPPLPVGLQLLGQPWHEGTLLRAAAALEAAQGEVVPLPEVYYDVLAAAAGA